MITKMASDDFYAQLDSGIRFAVRVLHAAGFETCQSCQGGAGHAYSVPTVEMAATSRDSDGFGALAALHKYGLPVSSISLTWPIANGLPFEKNWRIEFFKLMDDRADELPMFIYGYNTGSEDVK